MGVDKVYVLHLDQVCRLAEARRAVTLEIRPGVDSAGTYAGTVLARVYLHVLDGGELLLRSRLDGAGMYLGLTLGGYGHVWRCWSGRPSDGARRAARWR